MKRHLLFCLTPLSFLNERSAYWTESQRLTFRLSSLRALCFDGRRSLWARPLVAAGISQLLSGPLFDGSARTYKHIPCEHASLSDTQALTSAQWMLLALRSLLGAWSNLQSLPLLYVMYVFTWLSVFLLARNIPFIPATWEITRRTVHGSKWNKVRLCASKHHYFAHILKLICSEWMQCAAKQITCLGAMQPHRQACSVFPTKPNTATNAEWKMIDCLETCE